MDGLSSLAWLLPLLVGFAAGFVNALAGGGPILAVATLAALGLPANVASLTSTVALLPGQVVAGWHGRASLLAVGAARRSVIGVALVGGAAGAGLLLVTPAALFARMLPGLIVIATALYAWNSRTRMPAPSGATDRRRRGLALWMVPLAIYGGFYGGGNSFLVLALLAYAGIGAPGAVHAKNVLILLINVAATAVFIWSGAVAWTVALPLALGALVGAMVGARTIDRVPAAWLRRIVVLLGFGLALWLAVRWSAAEAGDVDAEPLQLVVEGLARQP